MAGPDAPPTFHRGQAAPRGHDEEARLFDGKLALITNAPDLTPTEAVARYRALADIERGFRVLKSDIEIAPVHHRLPDRIRAHALICFLAPVLWRVMRIRLKANGHTAMAERSPPRPMRSSPPRPRAAGLDRCPPPGLTAMKLKLDTTPDLVAAMAAEIRAGEKAVTAATREAGTSLKAAWRAQITGAGLGQRLARTIRSEQFPKGKPTPSVTMRIRRSARKRRLSRERGDPKFDKIGLDLARFSRPERV